MLVVDTSALLAAADNADPDHAACASALVGAGPLVTTALVVAETAYLVGRQLGAAAEAGFFRAVANGDLRVEPLMPSDTVRIAEYGLHAFTIRGTSSPSCPQSPCEAAKMCGLQSHT